MTTAVAHDLVQKSLVGEALDAGPVAVFVADDDGKYLAVNAYACELLGYDREELLLLRVADVAVNDDAAADYDALLKTGAGAGTATLRHKDGGSHRRYRAAATTVGGMDLFVGVC